MTVRTVLGASLLVATCVACSSSKPAKYPSTKGLTPGEAREMYNTTPQSHAALSHEKALAERERLWRTEEE